MIEEFERAQCLAAAQDRAAGKNVAVAAVSGASIEESELLAGWASLKDNLHGVGTRVGYRSFLAILEDTESDVQAMVDLFSSEMPSRAFWRFVIAPLSGSEDFLSAITEIEWRANKAVQHQEMPALTVVKVGNAL